MRTGFGRVILAAVVFGGCTGSIGTGGSGLAPSQGTPGSPSSSGASAVGTAASGASGGLGAPGSSGASGGSPASGGTSPSTGGTSASPASCASAPLAYGDAYIRRLTVWEYVNTVTDILSVPPALNVGALLPADIRANGFSNDFGGQLVSVDHATAYQAAADTIGASLTQTPTWLTSFAACADTTATCRDAVVNALGLRLFRRPATMGEVAAFGSLFDTAVAAGKTKTADAAVVVVRAMLQSPQFLYRLEAQLPPTAGALARPLDNYEIASRLSYFLWSSAPDATLLAAAQAGDLTTPANLASQVARMITQPHARDVIQRYFREWLSLDDLDDANRGGAFTPQLAADMKQETLSDVADQLWDSAQPLLSMFTTTTTLVTPALAQYYGLGAPGPGGHYTTNTAQGRVGLFTHASVLTVDGDANASIVLRGLYMFRKVLCQDVPAPPPGATSVVLAPPTSSLRTQSTARLATQPCESCHGQFDPLAYAFETFDNMGGWQTKDVNGNAVEHDGWITVRGGANVPYMGVADYMAELAQDARVPACIATHGAQFAWGRAMDAVADQCMLQDIGTRMSAAAKPTFSDLMVAVATSPYFVYTAVQ